MEQQKNLPPIKSFRAANIEASVGRTVMKKIERQD